MNFADLPQSQRVFITYLAWVDASSRALPPGASPRTIARIDRRIGELQHQFAVECLRGKTVMATL